MKTTITQPSTVRAITILVALEALGIIAYAVMLVLAFSQSGLGLGNVIMLALFFVAVAAVLGVSARNLGRGKSSARSMILVWQLFLVIIGVQILLGGQPLLGVLGVVLGGAILVLLFVPATQKFLEEHSQPRI